jgi:hypothetical protein
MATTVAGNELTAQHRVAQLAIRARFLQEFLRLWPLMNTDDLDEAAAAWVGAVVDLVLRFRAASSTEALTYYSALRDAEIGEPLPVRDAYVNLGAPNLTAIQTSLLVTGPIGIKQRIARGMPVRQARTHAFTAAAGAASRHVLNGGRQLIVEAAERDPVTTYYARVTDGDPCAFCALLASRGAVYASESTAVRTTARSKKRGPGKEFHDDCGCGVEPGWNVKPEMSELAKKWDKLYEDSTKDAGPGKKKLKAFRAAYNAQRPGKPSAEE